MGEPLKNLLIMLGAIVVILILIIVLFRGKSPVMKFLNLFLEEDENFSNHRSQTSASYRQSVSRQPVQSQQMTYDQPEGTPVQSKRSQSQYSQKKTSEPIVEMATLIQKSDDRLRIIERDGSVKLIDEYYELIFETRKGQQLKITCSREAYDKIPFDEQGSLTYKRGVLVKFKMYDSTVYNIE